MKNFIVHASKHGVVEIDIIGAIGEDIFTEGNTLESVRADLHNENQDIKEVIVNLASLGGLAHEGLAIHDLLVTMDAKITANIMGFTASAGSFIAMAADQINISENVMFLIHQSLAGVIGNVDDLKAAIKDLEKIDARQVAIFTRKTGKSETEIRDLMALDEWLTAEEARDFGFVDAITEPSSLKIAARATIEQINASKLPNIKLNKMDDNFLASIKEQITDALSPILAKFKGKEDDADAFTQEVEAKVKELSDHFSEQLSLATKEASDAAESIESLTAQVAEKDSEITASAEKIEALTADLDKAKAGKIEPPKDEDAGSGADDNSVPSGMTAFTARFKGKYGKKQ